MNCVIRVRWLLLVTVTLTVTLDGTRVMPIIALANAKVSVPC